MTQAKQTPGQWIVQEIAQSSGDTLIRSMSGDTIARVARYGPFSETPDADEANARLIAAAPELLEALQQVLGDLSASWVHNQPCWIKAKAAVAKATGEA